MPRVKVKLPWSDELIEGEINRDGSENVFLREDNGTMVAININWILQEQSGLYQKYRVERVDGSSGPGGKHEKCRYFVIDLDHDENADAAMEAYASSCEKKYPELAKDIRQFLNRHDWILKI